MESWTIPIEYKNSPFDKSIESIKSTNVYGAVLLSRYYLSLANEMQQSNGKLDYSDRIYEFSIWQIDRIDRIDKRLWGSSTKPILSKSR